MAGVGDRIIEYARAQIGDPYVWGAEGPDGFDCSGLVYAAYKAAGLNVKRTTAANLGRQGQAVDEEHAQPGDVVYFDNPGATDHVGLYMGNGQMIEAQTTGVPVKVSPIAGRGVTSIRRMPEVFLASADGGPGAVWGEVKDGVSGVGGAVKDGASVIGDSVLGVFGGWQSSLVSIGLKMTAAAAAAGLVIVGARTALQDKG